jgi:hypothetical protein
MNWTMLFIAFALAVIMGMAFSALLIQLRPQWSPRRRMLVAASWLPGIVVLLTLGGLIVVLLSGPGAGENMQDLAVAATLAIGAFFAVLGFAGGLVGAALAQRRRRQ